MFEVKTVFQDLQERGGCEDLREQRDLLAMRERRERKERLDL